MTDWKRSPSLVRLLYPLILLLALTGSRSVVARLTATFCPEDVQPHPLSTSNDGTVKDRQPRPSRRYHDRSLTHPIKARVIALIPQQFPPNLLAAADSAYAGEGPPPFTSDNSCLDVTIPAYLAPFRQAARLGSLSPPASPPLHL